MFPPTLPGLWPCPPVPRWPGPWGCPCKDLPPTRDSVQVNMRQEQLFTFAPSQDHNRRNRPDLGGRESRRRQSQAGTRTVGGQQSVQARAGLNPGAGAGGSGEHPVSQSVKEETPQPYPEQWTGTGRGYGAATASPDPMVRPPHPPPALGPATGDSSQALPP